MASAHCLCFPPSTMGESSLVSIMFFLFTLTMVVWCELRYLHCLARCAWDNGQRDLQYSSLQHAAQCSWASLHRCFDRISHRVSHTIYLNNFPSSSSVFFSLSYDFTFINLIIYLGRTSQGLLTINFLSISLTATLASVSPSSVSGPSYQLL